MKLFGQEIEIAKAEFHMTQAGSAVMGTMIVFSKGEDSEDVITSFSSHLEGEVSEESMTDLTKKLTQDYVEWQKYMEGHDDE